MPLLPTSTLCRWAPPGSSSCSAWGLRVTATLMAPCAPPSGQTHQTTRAVGCARWSDSGRQHRGVEQQQRAPAHHSQQHGRGARPMPPQMPLGCTQRRRDQHPSDGGHLTQLLRSRSPHHHRQSRHPAVTAWTEPHVCQLLRCLGHMPGRWWRIAPWTARSASWRGASCMGSCASAPSCDTSIRAQLQHSSAPMPAAQAHLPHSATSSSPAQLQRRSLHGCVPSGLPSQARQRRRAAPTCSWQMTGGHGRQHRRCCLCGSACALPCWPACMQPTALDMHIPQLSRRPGQWQPGSWRSCAQTCSAIGYLWVEACAGQGACAQHGIGDGTRSSQGRPTWSAGATAACCAP